MTRTIQDIDYYKQFDKIFFEDETLQERLDNFDLNDYRGWFNDTAYREIVICVDEWNDAGTLEHWHNISS
jgi:hypothetical protein|tara:strand:- start:5 stop:214 length:210 start_codon:yes stop_codon:yes gene_type:complete